MYVYVCSHVCTVCTHTSLFPPKILHRYIHTFILYIHMYVLYVHIKYNMYLFNTATSEDGALPKSGLYCLACFNTASTRAGLVATVLPAVVIFKSLQSCRSSGSCSNSRRKGRSFRACAIGGGIVYHTIVPCKTHVHTVGGV